MLRYIYIIIIYKASSTRHARDIARTVLKGGAHLEFEYFVGPPPEPRGKPRIWAFQEEDRQGQGDVGALLAPLITFLHAQVHTIMVNVRKLVAYLVF